MSHTCSHIYDTGGICKSFAVTGQRYCIHHLRHRARRLHAAQSHARGERFQFNLPPLESMHAVHSALSQLAEAIAAGVIDRHSANLLLSVLRVASGNLRHPEKWQPNLYESAEPAPDIDVSSDYGLPADPDLDTPPDGAFPQDETSHGVMLSEERLATPPFSTASADESVGGQSDNSPAMPFSGNYSGFHHSRERSGGRPATARGWPILVAICWRQGGCQRVRLPHSAFFWRAGSFLTVPDEALFLDSAHLGIGPEIGANSHGLKYIAITTAISGGYKQFSPNPMKK